MKKLICFSVFIAMLFTFASCEDMTVTTGNGDNKVVGNGKVVTQVRELPEFNEIRMEGVFNVFIANGEKSSVRVQTDENIQPVIVASVEGDVLTIKMKDSTSLSKMSKIDVYITAPGLRKISSEGVGKLRCLNRLVLKELELNCKGVGTTNIDLQAERLIVNSEIVGGLYLSGDVKQVSIDHKGVGGIRAFNLRAERMDLNIEGVGGAEVYVTKALTVDAKGVGGVKYKGNPEVKNIRNKGVGKVTPVE